MGCITSPILLEGETGTGKSVLAKKIHDISHHSKKNFIHLNLASLRDDLIESELFGHTKGSFTGALWDKKGFFETIGEGTLFLDEIGDLSLESQKKLLMVFEEKVFFPVGSCKEKRFLGRIITATNRDLKNLMREGRFRKDLYFRLNVFSHRLPSLKEDKRKLESLWNFYFDRYKKEFHKEHLRATHQMMIFIHTHNWPGNIRELKNLAEYVVCVSHEKVDTDCLPPWIIHDKNDESPSEEICSYEKAKNNFEKKFLLKALSFNKGNVTLTAKTINMGKATLIGKNKKHGIDPLLMKISTRDAHSILSETHL